MVFPSSFKSQYLRSFQLLVLSRAFAAKICARHAALPFHCVARHINTGIRILFTPTQMLLERSSSHPKMEVPKAEGMAQPQIIISLFFPFFFPCLLVLRLLSHVNNSFFVSSASFGKLLLTFSKRILYMPIGAVIFKKYISFKCCHVFTQPLLAIKICQTNPLLI